ncbi:MAG: ATP/GTP-binding protein [bacterium]|nr:MAG: ATP/GTP-binding protein [bacterium]
MKKLVLLVLAGILFALPLFSRSLKPVWVTKKVLKVPESVFYQAKNKLIYVSNINGKPSAKNGNGFISLLNENGQIIKLRWATGLNAPKGMAVKGNHLFVSDIDRLAEINLSSGKIIRFIAFPGAKFLNDVVEGPEGEIYVTDSDLGAVFVVKAGKAHLWSTNPLLKGANGLAVNRGELFIGANGHLLEANPKTGKIRIVVHVTGDIDGLIPLGNGRFILSDWAGKIYLISSDKAPVILSNTTKQKINAADLGFIPGKKIILIPTFFDNRVIAKQLTGF